MIATVEMPPPVRERQRVFEQWYETLFPAVAHFVSKRKGSLNDAMDIFHDALIIFYEKTQQDGFVPCISEEAYVLGIVKHLWIRKYNNSRNIVALDEAERAIDLPADYFPSISTSRLLIFLESVGDKCLNLLRSFYFDNKRIAEIKESFHFSSEHSASVQKFKCIEKLRESAKQQKNLYESLFE